MCEYIDMLEARGEKRGIVIGEERGIEIGERRGIAKGKEEGENRLSSLIQVLLKEKKYGEIEQAAGDSGKRRELYRIYGI